MSYGPSLPAKKHFAIHIVEETKSKYSTGPAINSIDMHIAMILHENKQMCAICQSFDILHIKLKIETK